MPNYSQNVANKRKFGITKDEYWKSEYVFVLWKFRMKFGERVWNLLAKVTPTSDYQYKTEYIQALWRWVGD